MSQQRHAANLLATADHPGTALLLSGTVAAKLNGTDVSSSSIAGNEKEVGTETPGQGRRHTGYEAYRARARSRVRPQSGAGGWF